MPYQFPGRQLRRFCTLRSGARAPALPMPSLPEKCHCGIGDGEVRVTCCGSKCRFRPKIGTGPSLGRRLPRHAASPRCRETQRPEAKSPGASAHRGSPFHFATLASAVRDNVGTTYDNARQLPMNPRGEPHSAK